jgi:uncharacterized protein YggE
MLLSQGVTIGAAMLLVVGSLATSAEAQTYGVTAAQEEHPVVFVSAEAEVRIAPDRAHLSVAVETRGRTSQLAGAENARIQTAVLDALRRQGVVAGQLQTRAVQVVPEYEYPRDGGRPTVTGYIARNEVVVEVQDLAKIGGLIDAALAQGATNVGGPQFSLANPDSARREALDMAVRKAMADARVMALAAGVRVGRVLELASEASVVPMAEMSQVRMRVAAADAAPTPVETGLITVRSSVRLKMALLP